MSHSLLIRLAGLGLIILLAGIGWLYLRRRKKVETGVAIGALALMVSATVPLLAKPVEDAWTPITAPGAQSPPALPPAVASPGDAKDVLGAGWGPPREMFSINSPAPFVTLNSITDNPNFGDERAFYGVRQVDESCSQSSTLWQRHEKVDDGDYLRFRVFVGNSVADNLDADGSRTAHGLRVKVNLPSVIGDRKTGSAGQAESSAILSADNATPNEYWYIILLSSAQSVRLDLVPGMSTLETNHFKDGGLPLSDAFLYKPGMLLGYDKLDGNLRAGYKYSMYLTFCVKVAAVRD